MRDHHPLFHVLLAIAVIVSTAPTISAASNLLPTRKHLSDIEISGHFRAVGFLPWHEGLTLGDALDETEGFREYAYLVYITPEDWDTKDLPPSAMTKIAPEQLGAGSEKRGILLHKGDRVFAGARFPTKTDPAPLIDAAQRLLTVLGFKDNDSSTSAESLDASKFQRRLGSIRANSEMVKLYWTHARHNKDREAVRMEQLRETQKALANLEENLSQIAILLPKIKVEASSSEVQGAMQLLRSEIQKYRTAISAGFP